jgi:outer membrane protein TolC
MESILFSDEYFMKQALLEAKTNLYIAIANWKSALEQVRLQQEAIQRYQRMLAIAEAAFKLGKFNRVEVAQTQTQYETALAGLMETRLRAIQQYHALKRLLATD